MAVTTEYALEAADPDCLDPAEAAALLCDAPWQRLAVVGDSVAEGISEEVEGYRYLPAADRVAEALAVGRPEFEYRNLGVRGLRAGPVRDGQLEAALAFGPDVVIVAAGGNDALGREFDADQLRRDIASIVEPLAASGALVATVGLFDLARSGMVPPAYAPMMIDRFDALDAITADVVQAAGGVHIDTHHHPRSADPGIYSSDGIHCNARGHAIAATAMVRALARVVSA